jgi:hypothetical protein
VRGTPGAVFRTMTPIIAAWPGRTFDLPPDCLANAICVAAVGDVEVGLVAGEGLHERRVPEQDAVDGL